MSVGFSILQQIKFAFMRCHSVFAFQYLVYIWFPYLVIIIFLLNLISHWFFNSNIFVLNFFFFFLKKTHAFGCPSFSYFLMIILFSFLFFSFFFFILCVSLFFFVLRNAFSMGLYLELPTVSLPYFMDIKVRINPSRYFGN